MAVTADILRRLGKLRLAPEAFEEVLSIIADIQSIDEARRAGQRERTARHRAARRDGNVTVTLQSRDANVTGVGPNDPSPLPPHTPPITPTPNTIPPVSPDGLPAPKGADDAADEAAAKVGDREAVDRGGKAARARRIPADFAESPEALAVCAEMGLTGAEAAEALAEFCDFWMAEGGQRARKLDWSRTLRNRLREIGRRRPSARASPPRPRSSNGYFDLLRDELAGSDDQRSDPQRQHLRLAAGAR